MKEYVVCKSCGYVMVKGKLKDKCPACGVPAKLFEPYVERVSPKRKFLLSLDMHPVIVHFTQAFTTTIPILCLCSLIAAGDLRNNLLSTVRVLSFLLPLVVPAAMAAGMFDGKIRFRKLTNALLMRKILLGSLFLLLALANLAVVLFAGLEAGGLFVVLGLTLCAVVAASILARIGVSLLNAKFPG